MPQSLAQIYLHIVFSTKNREALISADVQPRLHSYLAGAGKAIGCPVVIVGGVADHVHLLVRLSRTITVADVLKAFKSESSKWMKSDAACLDFAWQAGYGVFSVSASHVDAVTEYICKQPEHHQRRDFKEEFRELLKRYHVTYDEAYVWD